MRKERRITRGEAEDEPQNGQQTWKAVLMRPVPARDFRSLSILLHWL
jgi:hypothetical protein